MLLAVVFFAAAIPWHMASASTVRSVNASQSGDTVHLKVAVQGGVGGTVSSFALAGPDRIVVDLAGSAAGTASGAGSGAVSQVRVGQFTPEVTRLVIDLSRPMQLADVSVSANRAELTLALRPVSAAAFAAQVRAPRMQHNVGAVAPQQPTPAPAAAPLPAAPARSGPPGEAVVTEPIVKGRPVTVAKGSSAARGQRPLVVIDAGHGGHDPGAISVWQQRREKDVTLAVARLIKKELDDSGRVRAVLTRSDDRFLVLAERREVARRLKADLFISVHADSAPNASARGATVYTLSEVASDREAARLAARENKADIINGVDLGREASDISSILIDLARRDTMNVSSSFAALLQREMSPYVSFRTNYHRFAGFAVLKAPDTPSVLLEMGYLSNEDDSKFLFSSSGQRAIAKGVKNAIEAHFARRQR